MECCVDESEREADTGRLEESGNGKSGLREVGAGITPICEGDSFF